MGVHRSQPIPKPGVRQGRFHTWGARPREAMGKPWRCHGAGNRSRRLCSRARMCQRPDENSEGGQIDRYRIVRTIGHGRLSVVYEVLDEDGTRLALRVLSTAIEGDDVAFERFRREALMAERIVHPNVVPVLGHGETGGRPYVVLRLMTGGSLADLVAAGPMPLERLVTLLLGVATGVDAVHARGLVHRDIKPENI